MSALTFPTVHLNGTHGPDLLEAQLKARAAIWDALKVLAEAFPNGRDYYPQGPDAIEKAIDEHCARATALENVYRELGEIAESISDQIR